MSYLLGGCLCAKGGFSAVLEAALIGLPVYASRLFEQSLTCAEDSLSGLKPWQHVVPAGRAMSVFRDKLAIQQRGSTVTSCVAQRYTKQEAGR